MTFHIHPNTTLGAVSLKVRDIELTSTFYKTILGFSVLKKEGNRLFLTANGVDSLIILEHTPNAKPKSPHAAGLYHLAILLPSRKDLSNFLRHIAETGYPVTGASDHDFSEAIYLSDPEQNGIEVYADRPKDLWKRDAKGYLEAPTYALNVRNLLSETTTNNWEGMPIGTAMGHIHLHASNLEQSEEFYHDILGFDINFSSQLRSQFMGQFVSAGGYHHHIGFNIWKGNNAPTLDPTQLGLAYYTINLPNESELYKVKNRLEEENYVIIPADNGFQVDDPSGIAIRFTVK